MGIIKGVLVFGFAIMVLWSCRKNGMSSRSAKRLSWVSFYNKSQFTHFREIDSILYDNNNRMIECRRTFIDSFFNTGGFFVSGGISQYNYVFRYSGFDTLPSSYLFIASSNPIDTPLHVLTYNNINQLIKDSDLEQVSNIYLSYAPNVIATYSTSISGSRIPRIDSFILQNDNIVSHSYTWPRLSSPNSVDQITYSTIPSPLYNFKGIGVLLYFLFEPQNFYWTFSRNLPTSVINSKNLRDISMSWIPDPDGTSISGNGYYNGSLVLITFGYR